ncbi:tetraacyldisaccharide 4'-kinase [Ideonella benzenivorans]|uniref:tetraacyldisaccharide 4'-kinase n=1 Tax=Ideonella benzenivorans TaxID=2831643 RepID=UPI001CED4A44|nr:tetraacyldisaccharide 4'-kinase [Ideonella benzenivorans]
MTTSRLANWLQRQWWQPRPGMAACLLWPLSLLYVALSSLQRWRGRRWAQRQRPLRTPVIVVGNLIVGGAGKTPTTIGLLQALQARGWHPGVVSRGYGRQDDEMVEVHADTPAGVAGDEPLLIHLRTRAPLMVGRDRFAAARALLDRHPEIDVLLADDGLQHARLPRDLAIVVFDARGQGNGLPLPAGPLRQRLPRELPDDWQVLYNADRPSTRLPGPCAQRRLSGAALLPHWWQGLPPSPEALRTLAGQSQQHPLVAAAGIAEPERFFRQLEQAGLRLSRLPLPDHAVLHPPPWPTDASDVLITEKDAVKLQPQALPPLPRLWVVALDLQLPDDLLRRVDQALLHSKNTHHDR